MCFVKGSEPLNNVFNFRFCHRKTKQRLQSVCKRRFSCECLPAVDLFSSDYISIRAFPLSTLHIWLSHFCQLSCYVHIRSGCVYPQCRALQAGQSSLLRSSSEIDCTFTPPPPWKQTRVPWKPRKQHQWECTLNKFIPKALAVFSSPSSSLLNSFCIMFLE